MESTGRLYLCQRCRLQVIICRRCDRGQIYCSDACSKAARCEALRASSRRYQQSSKGRFKHAERAHRYRQRKNKVTHQGSTLPAQGDLLAANSVPDRELGDAKPLSSNKSDIVTFAAQSAQNSSVESFCTGIGFPTSLNLTEEEPNMTILPELEAQILRYYHVEKWRTGTIAAQLGVHHGTVTRILAAGVKYFCLK